MNGVVTVGGTAVETSCGGSWEGNVRVAAFGMGVSGGEASAASSGEASVGRFTG